MSYKSQVGLSIDTQVLKERLESLCEEERELLSELLETVDHTKEADGYTLYVWHSVKWHENEYRDVRLVMDLIDDNENHCVFVEVGEDLEDIRSKGFGEDPFYLGVSREICWD